MISAPTITCWSRHCPPPVAGGSALPSGMSSTVCRKPQVAAAKGADMVAVCCSEKWPVCYTFDGQWIEVFSVMHDLVTGMGYNGKGVVFYHVEGQKQATIDRWTDVEDQDFVYLADGRSDEEHEVIMRELEKVGYSYAVLDCFGFSPELRDRIQVRLGIPAYLPLTSLACAVRAAKRVDLAHPKDRR